MISRIRAQAAAAPRTARESGLAIGKLAGIVVAVGLVASAGSYMLSFGSRSHAAELASAHATIEAYGTVGGDADEFVGIVPVAPRVLEREPDPVVKEVLVEVVVTATPTPVPTATPTANIVRVYEYVEVPFEVTRVVYQFADPMPTATPTRLARGQVVICVYAAGVKELYVGDQGVVNGGCASVYPAESGQTHVPVKVNR